VGRLGQLCLQQQTEAVEARSRAAPCSASSAASIRRLCSRHGRRLVSGRGDEVTPAAADVMHLLVAAALTYTLGFERDLRGAPAGDRVFALIGVGAGIVGVLAVHGAPTALQGALTGIGFIGAGLVFR
jgi:MgtC family